MAPTPPLTQPTLASLIEKFKCGGLGLADAVNLIGRIISNSFSSSEGKIVLTVEGSSFVIPKYDAVGFTYVDSGAANDDLISTQLFYKNEDLVATLTYSYVGSTNNIYQIILTLP